MNCEQGTVGSQRNDEIGAGSSCVGSAWEDVPLPLRGPAWSGELRWGVSWQFLLSSSWAGALVKAVGDKHGRRAAPWSPGESTATRFSGANVRVYCLRKDLGLFQNSSDTMEGVKILGFSEHSGL